MTRVGVLTGMAGEARLVERAVTGVEPPPIIACAGAEAGRARREASRLVAEGAAALLSFGLCAGLDPGLRPGRLVCPERVTSPDGPVRPVDRTWRITALAALDSIGRDATDGALAGCAHMLARPADKRALATRTGAVAADMESHVLAEAAAEAALPFLVLRAVGDPAERALPPAALDALTDDGETRPLAVMLGLLRDPRQLPALVRLAWEARAAYASLGDVARLGPAVFLGP